MEDYHQPITAVFSKKCRIFSKIKSIRVFSSWFVTKNSRSIRVYILWQVTSDETMINFYDSWIILYYIIMYYDVHFFDLMWFCHYVICFCHFLVFVCHYIVYAYMVGFCHNAWISVLLFRAKRLYVIVLSKTIFNMAIGFWGQGLGWYGGGFCI